MNICHCLCSASHDFTAQGPLRACAKPVQAVVVVRTAGTLAATMGPTHDIPMCLPCARACEAVSPRFLRWRGVGDPALARLN